MYFSSKLINLYKNFKTIISQIDLAIPKIYWD